MVKFLDDTGGSKGRFHGTSRAGLIVVASTDEQKKHRWAEVVALGPKCDGIAIGDFVLLENLQWMEHNLIDGEKVWKTDDSKILAVTNDRSACQLQ